MWQFNRKGVCMYLLSYGGPWTLITTHVLWNSKINALAHCNTSICLDYFWGRVFLSEGLLPNFSPYPGWDKQCEAAFLWWRSSVKLSPNGTAPLVSSRPSDHTQQCWVVDWFYSLSAWTWGRRLQHLFVCLNSYRGCCWRWCGAEAVSTRIF